VAFCRILPSKKSIEQHKINYRYVLKTMNLNTNNMKKVGSRTLFNVQIEEKEKESKFAF